jgi:hypothetical protein
MCNFDAGELPFGEPAIAGKNAWITKHGDLRRSRCIFANREKDHLAPRTRHQGYLDQPSLLDERGRFVGMLWHEVSPLAPLSIVYQPREND